MLEYVRMGFASNSSSSHSIILLNDKTENKTYIEDNSNYSSDFFLVEEKDKMNYLLNQCLLNFQEKLGPTEAKKLIREIFGKSFRTKEIDHQSMMLLPEKVDDSLKIEFLKQLVNYISKNKRIGIWGSWDSEDTSIYDSYPGIPKDLFSLVSQNTTVLRKDGDYQWTLFDKKYGYKVRLKLNDTISPLLRPSTPELLDVSITDKCLSNCNFCYRGSNIDGKFAEFSSIKKVIDAAQNLKVMEIVFGGGEPTLHPDFSKILEYTKNSGICANFTTNTTEWMNNNEIMLNILKNTSALTISVHSLEDLKAKESAVKRAKDILTKHRQEYLLEAYDALDALYSVTYQIVVDLLPEEELENILKYSRGSRIGLSMVGFKNTGRAKNIKCQKHENLKNIIEATFDYRSGYNYFSVDTCFLKEYPEFMQELTCNIREGWESYFIDVTNEYFSISSFSPEIKKVNLKENGEEVESEMYSYFKNLEPQ
jgi:MoaA/NifB/PqqE/SkfB family radical SAM enzyme